MVAGHLVNQDVVDEPAVIVEQGGVVDLSRVEPRDGVGGDVVGELGGFRSADFDFAHMGHVEEAHGGAHGAVLVDHAGVLDGHVPAPEIHHSGAQRPMDGVQGRDTKRRGAWH